MNNNPFYYHYSKRLLVTIALSLLSISNSVYAGELSSLSRLTISIGNPHEQVEATLAKVFVGEDELRKQYPGMDFSNVSVLKCTMHNCTGAYTVVEGVLKNEAGIPMNLGARFKSRFMSVDFNPATHKAYRIYYSQGANVADDKKACAPILQQQFDKMKVKYGNDINVFPPRAVIDNGDEDYRVLIECGFGGYITKQEHITSQALKKGPSSTKTSLD